MSRRMTSRVLGLAALCLLAGVALAQNPPGFIAGTVRDKGVSVLGATNYRLKVTITGISTDGCQLKDANVIVTATAPSRLVSYWYVKDGSEMSGITGSFLKNKQGCRIAEPLEIEDTGEPARLTGKMQCVTGFGSATFEHWFGWKPVGFIGKEVPKRIDLWLCADGTSGEITLP